MKDFLNTIKSKKNVVLAKGTSVQDLKDYVKELVLEKNQVNPRKLGRKEGESYLMPFGVAPLEEFGLPFDFVDGKIINEDVLQTKRDMAVVIWDEIYCHGRCSIDELCAKKKGYDPRLIQIVVNLMLQKHYLKKYKEKDGVKTLEVRTEKEMNKINSRKLEKKQT